MAMQVWYKPQEGDLNQPGATPLSMSWSEQVEEAFKTIARAGALAIGLPPKSGEELAHVVGRVAAALAPDPSDPSLYAHPAAGPAVAVVTNPAHKLARYAAKHFPRVYAHLERVPTLYKFETVRSSHPLSEEMRERRILGQTIFPETGQWAKMFIRDDVVRAIENEKALERLRRRDPSRFREVVTTIPHEMTHGLNVRAGRSRAAMGMPTKKATTVEHPMTHAERRWDEHFSGITVEGDDVSFSRRVMPEHLHRFVSSYADYPYGVRAREALTQRAAENMARKAGLITRKEIGDDLQGEELEAFRQMFGPNVQRLQQRLKQR